MKPGNPRRPADAREGANSCGIRIPKDKGKAGVGCMRPLPLKRSFLMGKALATDANLKGKWVAAVRTTSFSLVPRS